MIELHDVTQHYGVKPILRGISLRVERGELVVILGPNGMGKTTLLGVMAGVLSPQRGEVRIDGMLRRGSVEEELAIRKMSVYLPDQPWLPAARTGREFLLAVGRLYDLDDERLMDHVPHLLDLFDLGEQADSPIRSYSAGQQKKIALCSALVTEAPVLFLDEPFSGGLDPAGLLTLKRILQHHVRRKELTIVLTSPVPELVEEIASRIIVLHHGEILAFDTSRRTPADDRLPGLAGRRPRAPDLPRHHAQARRLFPGLSPMIGRLRQIVPGWPLGVFAGLFLLLEGPVLYWEWKIGRPLVELEVRPGTALIYVAAAFYGRYRAISLHPFYREDYRKWLELTPWTVHKPLPLGPIALIWEDGIVLGALILLSLTQPHHHSIRILNIFLIVHSAFLTATFWPTGVGTIGYLAAFGLGLAVRLWPSPWICFAVAASVYLLVYEGLWQSLARFPWGLEWSLSDLNNSKTLYGKARGSLLRLAVRSFFSRHQGGRAVQDQPDRCDPPEHACRLVDVLHPVAGSGPTGQDRAGDRALLLFGLLMPLSRLAIYIAGCYQCSDQFMGPHPHGAVDHSRVRCLLSWAFAFTPGGAWFSSFAVQAEFPGNRPGTGDHGAHSRGPDHASETEGLAIDRQAPDYRGTVPQGQNAEFVKVRLTPGSPSANHNEEKPAHRWAILRRGCPRCGHAIFQSPLAMYEVARAAGSISIAASQATSPGQCTSAMHLPSR